LINQTSLLLSCDENVAGVNTTPMPTVALQDKNQPFKAPYEYTKLNLANYTSGTLVQPL
jgi:hypothetical protein